MTSEIKHEFKKIESIEELNNLGNKLIQIRYPRHPKPDEFILGRLGRVKEPERTIDGEKIKDIVIYIKNGYRKVGTTITFDEYQNALQENKEIRPKVRKIHPEVYIPRVKKHEIEYMVMSEPSDRV